MADLVAVLRDGRVVQAARPPRSTARRRPRGGDVRGRGGRAPRDPRRRRRKDRAGAAARARAGRRERHVLLRPEQLHVDAGPEGSGVAATVHDVLFHGLDATVLLQLAAGQRVRARVPGTPRRAPRRRGDRAGVRAGSVLPGNAARPENADVTAVTEIGFADSLAAHGDRLALLPGHGRPISYRELDQRVAGAAERLGSTRRLVLLGPQRRRGVVAYLGALRGRPGCGSPAARSRGSRRRTTRTGGRRRAAE